MSEAAKPKVLGVVGSPDRRGRTQSLVRQALEGAAERGADTEVIFLANYSLPLCQDCRPWVCRNTRRCRLDTDGHFAFIANRLLAADAVVLGTPVYYGIASETATAFMQRMHRTQANQANGMPAAGIAVAGGTGGGLISGLRPVYHFFQMMGMRAVDPLPVTRFNWAEAQGSARAVGARLVGLAAERQGFSGLERLAWYDDLPYLGMSRVEERLLLVDQVVEAISDDESAEAASARRDYARARELFEAGEREAALPLIDTAYAQGVKAFEAARPS